MTALHVRSGGSHQLVVAIAAHHFASLAMDYFAHGAESALALGDWTEL